MNKLKLGNKVQMTDRCHNWHIEHLIECYTKPDCQFSEKDYEEVALLLLSKVKKVKLQGKVTGYGAPDDELKYKANFVKVKFKYRDMISESYYSEKDLKKL